MDAAIQSGTEIVTDKLTRRFGDLVAVAEVSIAVSRGEIFGLIGSNGAGKSTLVKMLTTLLPRSSGQASVAGYGDLIREQLGLGPDRLIVCGMAVGWPDPAAAVNGYVPERAALAEYTQWFDAAPAARR